MVGPFAQGISTVAESAPISIGTLLKRSFSGGDRGRLAEQYKQYQHPAGGALRVTDEDLQQTNSMPGVSAPGSA